MHFLLTMFVIIAFITVHEGHRSFIDELITMVVDLYVAGALFTFIAKHKS